MEEDGGAALCCRSDTPVSGAVPALEDAALKMACRKLKSLSQPVNGHHREPKDLLLLPRYHAQ